MTEKQDMTKAYLEQYKTMFGDVIERDIHIKRMKQEIFGGPTARVTAAIDAMMGKTTSGAHWKPDDLEKFKEELRIQEEEVNEFRKRMLTISEQIRKLDNGDSRTLLIGRYLNFKSWEEVGKSLNHDGEYARKELHETALDEFFEKYSDFLKSSPQ